MLVCCTAIAKKYREYPVAKKRRMFAEIEQQIAEAAPDAKAVAAASEACSRRCVIAACWLTASASTSLALLMPPLC